jgi:hypothetical protein
MSKNTSGHEGRPDIDPLEPITSGQQFVADHCRFWLHDEAPSPPEHLPELADPVVLTDLSEHVEDPGLKAPDPYPPIRSDMPFPTLNEVIELVRSVHEQPPPES